jgi:hypothetical protein
MTPIEQPYQELFDYLAKLLKNDTKRKSGGVNEAI